MVNLINKLLAADMLILLAGMIMLFVRPFDVDITFGISLIAAGFCFSIILFCVKWIITSKNG